MSEELRRVLEEIKSSTIEVNELTRKYDMKILLSAIDLDTATLDTETVLDSFYKEAK